MALNDERLESVPLATSLDEGPSEAQRRRRKRSAATAGLEVSPSALALRRRRIEREASEPRRGLEDDRLQILPLPAREGEEIDSDSARASEPTISESSDDIDLLSMRQWQERRARRLALRLFLEDLRAQQEGETDEATASDAAVALARSSVALSLFEAQETSDAATRVVSTFVEEPAETEAQSSSSRASEPVSPRRVRQLTSTLEAALLARSQLQRAMSTAISVVARNGRGRTEASADSTNLPTRQDEDPRSLSATASLIQARLRALQILAELSVLGRTSMGGRIAGGLTPETIEASTTRLTLTPNLPLDSEGPGTCRTLQSECMVCLEEFQTNDELRLLPCGHRYHCSCIDNWLSRSRNCPVCKHDVTK